MSDKIITEEEFQAMSPRARGYAVYMYGAREDQPNVPDERNPYKPGSEDNRAWYRGNTQAMLDVMDAEE